MNDEGGLHLEDATISSEVITVENKEKFSFVLDDLEETVLKKKYGELPAEEMVVKQSEVYDKSQLAFERLILNHPGDLFNNFITNREILVNEFEGILNSLLSDEEKAERELLEA